jgi:hypothetical protein
MSLSLRLVLGYNSITLSMEAENTSDTFVAINNPTQYQKAVLEF